MVTVTVCIGRSCYLKGSKDIVASLTRLIELQGLKDQINLTGTFCLGHCVEGVCVLLDGERFSLTPATTEEFFQNQVLPKVAQEEKK